MSGSDFNWDDAKIFLAVARSGTLTGAAQLVKSGIATISRRIERLEENIDTKLFVHHQTGYLLTDDGKELFLKAEEMENIALGFEQSVNSVGSLRGVVKLATSENIANLILIPNLGPFLENHPKLTIEINTGFSTLNIHGHEADLAVRMVKPERGNVTIRKLGTLGFGLYGSSSYLENRINLDESTDFEHDRFISWSESQSEFPAAKYLKRLLNGKMPSLTTTSLASQVSATVAGLGLSVLPHFLAIKNNLKAIPLEMGLEQEIWLAIHSDLCASRRVRAVADVVTDIVHENRLLLASGG